MELNNLADNNDNQPRRSASESRLSPFSSMKRSSSDGHISPMMLDDEYEAPPPPPPQELKPIRKPKQPSNIPKLRNSKNSASSVVSTNNKIAILKSNPPSRTR